VSDLSNYLEKNMINYASNFIDGLNLVIRNANLTSETKLHAMIALGDLCLAIEEHFQSHLVDSMNCLFFAAESTLQIPNTAEEDETSNRLRDAIIDAFISMLHGMQPVAESNKEFLKTLSDYVVNMLQYIDALLQKEKLQTNPDFVKNLYELYADMLELYGHLDNVKVTL
jgi:hypothetical protein